MLTGRFMHVNGHRTQTHLVQAYENNYFQTLKNNGYHVQYYGKNDVFSADAMNTSVSFWSPDIGTMSGPNAYKFGEAGYYSMLSKGSAVDKNSTQNGDYRAVVKALDWLKEMFGLPAKWPGVMVTGATMANFVCLAAARQWWGEELGFDVSETGLSDMPKMPVLTSGFVHASTLKAEVHMVRGILGEGAEARGHLRVRLEKRQHREEGSGHLEDALVDIGRRRRLERIGQPGKQRVVDTEQELAVGEDQLGLGGLEHRAQLREVAMHQGLQLCHIRALRHDQLVESWQHLGHVRW